MPKAKNKPSAPQLADVKQANKTAPSVTSRPVLITNRPLLQDPMMGGKTIAANKTPIPSAPILKPPSKQKAQALTKTKPPTPPTPEDVTPSTASIAPPISSPVTDNPVDKINASTRGQVEHEASVQELVNSKRYFLPVNAVEKRRSKQFVASGVLLSLLLAVIWVDIALDAGLIRLSGIKPLTHMFSN